MSLFSNLPFLGYCAINLVLVSLPYNYSESMFLKRGSRKAERVGNKLNNAATVLQ